MRGPEHYRAAEQAVEESRVCTTAGVSRMWLIKAQVHAQLAFTAAIVGLADEGDERAWREVLGHVAGQAEAAAGRLIPPDTCGSWVDGHRCILRPGHDEPCLPYRVPAAAEARPDPHPAPAGPASRDDGDLGEVIP